MILDSLSTASIFIPKLVEYSFQYRQLSPTQQSSTIMSIGDDENNTTVKGLLFYSDLIAFASTAITYDTWNYIPLMYEEIESFAYYANTLDTQFNNKISLYPNSQTILYLP